MKSIAFTILAALTVTFTARAGDNSEAGRKLLAKHQDAVVTVRMAIEQTLSLGGQMRKGESRSETTGTMIDPSGLTLVSFATINPSSTVKDAYRKAIAARGGDPASMEVESEIKELMIILPDGHEIEAEVALRDEELDLAFVRPKQKPASPMAFVDLKQEGTPQMLDEVLVINRLNKTAKRVPAASIGRIEAMVDKPRPFYVLGQTTWAYALGAPVFAFDGKLIGFIVLRNDKSPGDSTSGFLNSDLSRMGMMPVIRPPADIVDGAKQALEAKAPETQATQD